MKLIDPPADDGSQPGEIKKEELMWRTILLWKLGVSIAALMMLGEICLTQPWRGEYSFSESLQWMGVGGFFYCCS